MEEDTHPRRLLRPWDLRHEGGEELVRSQNVKTSVQWKKSDDDTRKSIGRISHH